MKTAFERLDAPKDSSVVHRSELESSLALVKGRLARIDLSDASAEALVTGGQFPDTGLRVRRADAARPV